MFTYEEVERKECLTYKGVESDVRRGRKERMFDI
jgi:hypothetical protein